MTAFLHFFPDGDRLASGHALIIPKLHIENIFEFDDHTYQELSGQARLLSKSIRDTMQALKIGAVVGGLSISHSHVNLASSENLAGLIPDSLTASNADAERIKASILTIFTSGL